MTSMLVGCTAGGSLVQPEPVIVTKYLAPDCGTPPARDPVELRILGPNFWEIRGGEFVISVGEYEDLSYNVSEIWKGVHQLRAEIDYYRKCLEDLKDVAENTDVG